MATYSRGQYKLKNPDKYIGIKTPIWRSSWEFAVMKMCDENVNIEKWASESIRIPYRNPLTGKNTIYVPDFFVSFVDKNNMKHAELWEIKPESHAVKEAVGKSKNNQAQFIINMAKWEAARAFCRQQGIAFRIITEHDLFYSTKKKKK
jgi:hypothetical protein